MARILTITGEPAVHQALRRMLELDGHEVVESSDGLQGRQLYVKHRIDVVVADVVTPGEEIFDVICAFRAFFPRSRIIGISDREIFSAAQLRRIAETIKIDAMLTKPLTGPGLKAAVDGLLNQASPCDVASVAGRP